MHLAVEDETLSGDAIEAGFLTEEILPWREDIPALLATDQRHGPALRSLEIRVVLRPVREDLRAEVTSRFQLCRDRLSARCLRLFELVQYGDVCMISHEYVPALPLQEYLDQLRSTPALQEVLRQLGELVLEEEALRSDLMFTPLDVLVGEDGVLRFDTAAALFRGAEMGGAEGEGSLATVQLLELVASRVLSMSRRRFVYRFGANKADNSLVLQLLDAIISGSPSGVWQLAMQISGHFPPRTALVAHTLVTQARTHSERQELRRGWYVLGLITLYSFTLIALVAIFSASKVGPGESEEKDLSSPTVGDIATEESY